MAAHERLFLVVLVTTSCSTALCDKSRPSVSSSCLLCQNDDIIVIIYHSHSQGIVVADASESPVDYFEKEQLPELGLDYVDALGTHHSTSVSEEFFVEKIWKRMEDMQKRNKTRYLAVNSEVELIWVRNCIVRGECIKQEYVLMESAWTPCFAIQGLWWLYDKNFARRYVHDEEREDGENGTTEGDDKLSYGMNIAQSSVALLRNFKIYAPWAMWWSWNNEC